MRVLHVINSLSGSGGAEQGMVREIGLLSTDIEQRLVTLYGDHSLAATVEQAGVPISSLGLAHTRSGWNWIAGARRLEEHINEFRPDVVHSSLTSANLVAGLATIKSRIPNLSTFTLSGDPRLVRELQPGARTRRAALLRSVVSWVARRPHIWFRALTQDSKITNCAASKVDLDRVFVLPRGVPTPEETLTTRSSLGLPTDAPILLNVARQAAQKGHPQLIEMLSIIHNEVPAHLVILGRPGDGSRDLSLAIARWGLDQSVTVVPYTSRPFDFYLNADVFVFSSLMEGLGTAVIEAMASGIPVVAYDIPPVREATGNGRFAYLTPVGDPAAMAKAAVDVLEGNADDRSQRATAWVKDAYSLPRIASQLESRLRELATSGSLSI